MGYSVMLSEVKEKKRFCQIRFDGRMKPVSGLGMGFFMDILEFLNGVMRVDLGSRQAGMP
jgi:hypothetical protein